MGPLHSAIETYPARRAPGEGAGPRQCARIADAFFVAGIVIALTLGASWGAHLLGRIGSSASFTAVSVHEVNAHGHAQVFGWVGLFVMGFAYRFFPAWKGARLPSVGLAYASLVLMLLGIALRSILEPFAHVSGAARHAALAGSAAELAAIGIFVGSVVAVFRRSSDRFEPGDGYLAAALGWFAVQAVWDAVYFAATSAAGSREQLLRLVATWQAPLREIQIYGFAMLMILGVSRRLFPGFYGFRPARPRWSTASLAAMNAGLVGMVAGFVMMGLVGRGWAALWYLGVLLLAFAGAAAVADLGILGGAARGDRSLKFFRSAYVWLLVSLAMLVALPGYQLGLLRWLAPASDASRIGFSHAYYGAIRHAVTVGFVSQMILGMAAKVVPWVRGMAETGLPALWTPFVLLNVGCWMRVSFQVISDFRTEAFAWIATSGVLEVAALAVWGAHLVRTIVRRVPRATGGEGDEASGGGATPRCAATHALSGWNLFG